MMICGVVRVRLRAANDASQPPEPIRHQQNQFESTQQSIQRRSSTTTMNNWKSIQNSLSSIDFQGSAGKFAKGFTSTVQQTKERLGQVAPDEITELPQGMNTKSQEMGIYHLCKTLL